MARREYQPVYVAYARAHGRSPGGMRRHDRRRWPGGCACGFLLWGNERLHAWAVLTGHPRAKDPYAPMWETDLKAYHTWLTVEPQPPLSGEKAKAA
jgi:hypothetical protein